MQKKRTYGTYPEDPSTFRTWCEIEREAKDRGFSREHAKLVYQRRFGQPCPFQTPAEAKAALSDGRPQQPQPVGSIPTLARPVGYPVTEPHASIQASVWHCDFETRSRCDIDRGSTGYAQDESTVVLCLGYRQGTEEVRLWTPLDGACPPELAASIAAKRPLWAFNCTFERDIWEYVCHRRMGWPQVPDELWRDTQALACAFALPGSLDGAAMGIQSSYRKDPAGAAAMKKLCQPRKPTKADPSEWHEDPALYSALYAYCKADVEAESELHQLLPPLSAEEEKVWQSVFLRNVRGIHVDADACQAILAMLQKAETRYHERLRDATGGVITEEQIGSHSVMLPWLASRGLRLADYRKETLTDALAKPDLPDDVRVALTTRLATGRTSTAKFAGMLDRRALDQRIHGSARYHGATTGRETSYGVQLQNLPKGERTPAQIEGILADFATGDLDQFEMLWGDPYAAASSCVRACLTAAPDHLLISADFSSIECRVVNWLADQQDALELFRKGVDVYRAMASLYFKIPPDQITRKQRDFGKVLVLGCGFGAGPSTIYRQATNPPYNCQVGPEEVDAGVKLWREQHANVVRSWYQTEGAALMAVRQQVVTQCCGGRVKFKMQGKHLRARLPSGRIITYPFAEIQPRETPWKEMKDAVTFMGINQDTKQWQRLHTYGGSLIENCFTGDTLVLTETGTKPLASITSQDRVWDGVEWVCTDGAVCHGEQEIGTWLGVRVTQDHLMHDGVSWKPVIALDASASAACLAQGRALAPWWSASQPPANTEKQPPAAIAAASGQGIAAACVEVSPSNARHARTPRRPPRVSIKTSWACSLTKPFETYGGIDTPASSLDATTPDAPCSRIMGPEASESIHPGGKIAWRSFATARRSADGMTRPSILIERITTKGTPLVISDSFPELATRETAATRASLNTKGRPIRMRISTSASAQPGPQTPYDSISTRGAPRNGLWTATGQRGAVYDLHNCGPRHRFMILTEEGPVLVHNCTQAVARDLMAAAMLRAEARGIPIVLTVHDEIVGEIHDNPLAITVPEFCALVSELPAWAAGLPVAAEGWVATRYQK